MPRAGLRRHALAARPSPSLLLLLLLLPMLRSADCVSCTKNGHKKDAEKNARPRPAAGDKEEKLSARRRRRKYCSCSLRKSLVHVGLVTPPDVIQVSESTQQKSNHWKIS